MSRHSFFLLNLRQRGDTIVEVLIAISIASAMLVGAFAVSNHSTKTVRDSEEHSEALSLLQGQLEGLRAAVTSTTAGADNPGWMTLCMSKNAADSEVQITDTANPPPECTGMGPGGLYNTQIDRTITGSVTTFVLHVTWKSILGGDASEQLFYRVYPES